MRYNKRAIMIVLGFLAFVTAMSLLVFSACAEESATPHIVYTHFTMDGLYGLVDLPDDGDTYYMRFTFFLPNDTFFVLVSPVPDVGYFYVWIACQSEYITMELVDRPCALAPGTYNIYDTLVLGYE